MLAEFELNELARAKRLRETYYPQLYVLMHSNKFFNLETIYTQSFSAN